MKGYSEARREIGRLRVAHDTAVTKYNLAVEEIRRLREQLRVAREKVARAAEIVETGDSRLMAVDGPCGGLPPDITLKEWREMYLCMSAALAQLAEPTEVDHD